MTCNDANRFLARLADAADSLDQTTRAAIETHLHDCASCRSELETQRVVAAWLRTRPMDAVSPDFSARLAEKIDAVSGWFGVADFRVWTLRLAPLAAVLAFAVFLGSETGSQAAVTVEEWTLGADTSSAVSLLWRADVSPDSLMETMLTGELPSGTAAGEADHVR